MLLVALLSFCSSFGGGAGAYRHPGSWSGLALLSLLFCFWGQTSFPVRWDWPSPCTIGPWPPSLICSSFLQVASLWAWFVQGHSFGSRSFGLRPVGVACVSKSGSGDVFSFLWSACRIGFRGVLARPSLGLCGSGLPPRMCVHGCPLLFAWVTRGHSCSWSLLGSQVGPSLSGLVTSLVWWFSGVF